ncbi:hypothetical protein GQQ29_26365 [Klebsiella pneumoniae]|nr:hypothetical protein [Klebsiella pneumoniae]
MPKISIFVFLLELYRGIGANSLFANVSGLEGVDSLLSNASVNLLLVCAFLSLVIGTVVGLGQFRFKRLMAYSTISHVGFLLLALAIASSADSALTSLGQDSVEAFLFYIMQYSLTNINMFFILLAFGYLIAQTTTVVQAGLKSYDVQFISELQGQFRSNPILGLSLAICLFSMAGVPPLVGFFAKYTVLYSAIHGGYVFLAIVAILASVVSAAYYLRVIRVVHFDAIPQDNIANNNVVVTDQEMGHSKVSSLHSYIVAVLTLFIMLFALNPNLLLDSPTVMALSLYTG